MIHAQQPLIRPDYQMFTQRDFLGIFFTPGRHLGLLYTYRGIRKTFGTVRSAEFRRLVKSHVYSRIRPPWPWSWQDNPQQSIKIFDFYGAIPAMRAFAIEARMLKQRRRHQRDYGAWAQSAITSFGCSRRDLQLDAFLVELVLDRMYRGLRWSTNLRNTLELVIDLCLT